MIYEDELTRGLMRKFDGFIVMFELIGYKSWTAFGGRRWAATGHRLLLVFGRREFNVVLKIIVDI